jgi:NFU1 iron-sulfur cluster scaffold homolog, mitochondrial
MPKIAEIESTPNPNAMKFILREPLSHGVTCSYENAEQAKDDELARRLFEIPHVSNVFYVDKWITVTQDGGADWKELVRKVAEPIRYAASAQAQTDANIATATSTMSNLSAEDQERFDRITSLLDEKIRPYLKSDGGDLNVIALSGNQLSVHYQGACGSCPSALSGTLGAIVNLVRTIEPDIEVIAV